MNSGKMVYRELFRRAAIGFPWGVAGVYLIFLLANLGVIPAPSGGALMMVSATMTEQWGSPVTAALVQFLWSGSLGAVLGTAGMPFRLERRILLCSILHFLLTAAVFTLAGWQCRWFPYLDTWLCLLGLFLLCYLLLWAVRYLGWRQDLLTLRQAAGLSSPQSRGTASYLLLAAAVELFLPWLLRLVDAPDFPVLTGLFYPYLFLPLFCFFSSTSLGKRKPWPWALGYAAICGALTVPNVFLLYNAFALFQTWTAGLSALLGGGLGLFRGRMKKSDVFKS